MVREKCGGQGSRHNDKTWPSLRHEIRSAAVVQWDEKAVYAAAKIPNQTRLIEADGAKLHIGSQGTAGFPEKVICRKESRDQ